MNVQVLDDPAAAVAERLVEAAAAGRHIVLTGGSTPKLAYEQAAETDADWSGATLWFGDERCVPPTHEQSNYAMATNALVRTHPGAVHRMQGELGPHEGAAAYERELRRVFGDGLPRFDLLLLGLGPDAHCASLFPNDDALGERERPVVGVDLPGMAPLVPRITLTLPALNAAREIVWLVAGEGKAGAVARAFAGRPGPEAPASLVTRGEAVTLVADPAAASRLGDRL